MFTQRKKKKKNLKEKTNQRQNVLFEEKKERIEPQAIGYDLLEEMKQDMFLFEKKKNIVKKL